MVINKGDPLDGFLTMMGMYNNNDIRKPLSFLFKPIHNYINIKLEDADELLPILVRYKKRREWFYRDIFFQQYLDSDRKEDFLDMDLRSFLFDQGIEFPFSTAKSPSGRTDIIANIDSENPLILEVKFIHNEKKYYKKRVIGGITQAYNYADDYFQKRAFVVVFNANESDCKFIIDSEDNFPPFITINGVKIYIISININPDGINASKQGKLKNIKITKDEILNEIK